MANCKFCAQPVRTAPVIHPACWQAQAEQLAQTFCDEYCHWPFVCQDETDLEENHCDSCALLRVLNLGC